MRVVFLEVISERKGHNRKPSIVVRAVIPRLVLRLALLILVITFFSMNITDLWTISGVFNMDVRTYATIPACMLECTAEKTGICESILHYAAISGEPQVNEIVVLCNDLRTWPREVQGI